MSLKNRLLAAAKKASLWGEKEITFGYFSILFCDLSVSINLLRKPSAKELEKDREEGFSPLLDGFGPYKIPTYGVTLEPFQFHIMGSDGDLCWSSPGFDMTHWIVQANCGWVNVGELAVERCGMQGRAAVDYIFGDSSYPCLGAGLRFRDSTRGLCGMTEFMPEWDQGLPERSQLGDSCHKIEIHEHDVETFIRRIKECRLPLGVWHGKE